MDWFLIVFLLIYTILPLLSPLFFHFGMDRFGWYIQTLYRFTCHQRPERSLFFFGPKLSYTIEELARNGYEPNIIGYPFIGNPELGYKVAFCVRDTFIYTTLIISAIISTASKKRLKVPWWIIVLLVVPLVIDGSLQFISELAHIMHYGPDITIAKPFYLSNNWNRAITGALFGTGLGFFLFSELRQSLNESCPGRTDNKE